MILLNDNDPKACAWLRELVREGHLEGTVDERPIQELSDLKAYREVHLFCGIGGWPYALRLAGWPHGRPVWTGSCPCQPFSSAGKRKAKEDARHLWPDMLRLIAECRPPTVFGEQVASRLGREWLSGVRADLEALGYAFGAADLCAAGVGAPHIRQRLWWVATAGLAPNASGAGVRANEHRANDGATAGAEGDGQERERLRSDAGDGEPTCDLPIAGYGECRRPSEQGPHSEGSAERDEEANQPERRGPIGDTHNAASERAEQRGEAEQEGDWSHHRVSRQTDTAGHWDAFDIIHYRDGKARRVEPGTFPLAHGVPGRVGLLRGYGNAIVPEVAAVFIKAYLSTEEQQ